MKKFVLSVFAALMLVMALMSSASADVTTNLGSFSAGSQIAQPIFTYTEDFSFDELQLPQGCTVEVVNEKVCLTGTPMAAGNFCFNIVCDDIYTCYVDILPDTPRVAVSGSESCAPNDNVVISVSAAVNDNGMLSYQWYLNNVPSVVGGEEIVGAVGSAFTVNTSANGTYYYYCNVTNNNCGLSVNAYSDIITVTVSEPVVNSLSIAQKPNKTDYKIGDSVDVTGMKIEVKFEDGSTKVIENGFTVTPKLIDEKTTAITVMYKDKEVTMPVNVEQKLTAVIYHLPTKTEYVVGDSLDTEGLILKVSSSGSSAPEFLTEGFKVEPILLKEVGTQAINVKYKDTTATFTVKVVEKGKDTLNIVTMPTKTDYTVGDKLELSGLVLELRNGDKTKAITSGYTCTLKELGTAGVQTVTVNYENLSCSFTVNVKEAEKTPVETPRVTPHASTIKVDAHHTLMVIIVILAVAALITLGIYIYVSRAQKKDQSIVSKIAENFKDKD